MNIFYFFGDSITLGVNVLPKESFFQLVTENLSKNFSIPPTKFYNLGACKNSSKEISARFEQEFSARNLPGSTPIFFLMCGVVDTMKFSETQYLTLEEGIIHFKDILIRAKNYGKIIAISPSPVANKEQNNRISSLITEQEKICKQLSIEYINIFPALNNEEYIADLKDGVHPSEKGNRLIADLMTSALKKLI